MNRAFRVLVLLLLMTGLFGCGTLQLNHIITGTECATREDCISDLHLPNPEHPDIVFVVEPLLMNEKASNSLGVSSYSSQTFYGNVELCIAKAISNEFQNSKVYFDNTSCSGPYARITPNKIVARGVAFAGQYMRINYELTVNSKTTSDFAKTDTEMFWSWTTVAQKQYPLSCRILAQHVRDLLMKEGIVLPSKTRE